MVNGADDPLQHSPVVCRNAEPQDVHSAGSVESDQQLRVDVFHTNPTDIVWELFCSPFLKLKTSSFVLVVFSLRLLTALRCVESEQETTQTHLVLSVMMMLDI